MKNKKGFTLIELLAVIIILAIIALIATPIVMRVIENSKKSAAERGAENYVHAVETEALALRGQGTILDGAYGIKENGNLCLDKSTTCNESGEIKIEMTGNKPSGGSIVISNGKVQATGTSIVIEDYTATIAENGSATATKSSESSAQNSRPNYYSFTSSGSISDGLPNDASESVPSGKSIYLGFDSADGEKIDAVYGCFVITQNNNPTPYCIQGGVSEELRAEVFNSNQGILNTAFTAFPNACRLDEGNYYCSTDGLVAYAYSDSGIDLGVYNAHCNVGNESFGCEEW